MKKPRTVGGKTKGIVNKPSIIIFTLSDFILTTHLAAKTPIKKVITIETDAVLSEISIGDQSIYPPTR
jgi:hypothetical protein